MKLSNEKLTELAAWHREAGNRLMAEGRPVSAHARWAQAQQCEREVAGRAV